MSNGWGQWDKGKGYGMELIKMPDILERTSEEFRPALMTDRVVPEIGFSGTRNQPKNGFKGSRIRLFSYFAKFFAIFDDFLKNFAALKTEMSNAQKFGKNCRKTPVFDLPFSHFYTALRKPGFRVPDDPSLLYLLCSPNSKRATWLDFWVGQQQAAALCHTGDFDKHFPS